MLKNFCDIKIGDKVYFTHIKELEPQGPCNVKELNVIGIETVPNATHFIITLSDSTVITPSGMFAFHTISEARISYENDVFTPISEEVYATDREECIRIASNIIKIKLKRLNKTIDECKKQLDSLVKLSINLFELKTEATKEVVTEAVIV